MARTGFVPPNPLTPLGQTRLLIGDVTYVPVAGQPTQGTYGIFGDDELALFLLQGGMNPKRATGYALMQMATAAALASASVTQDDMRVDITKRSNDLRLLAADYFAQADADDAAASGAESFFDIIIPGEGGYTSTESGTGWIPDPLHPGYEVQV